MLAYNSPNTVQLETVWELQDQLAQDHSQHFAGLWNEDGDLVVAVVGGDADIEQIRRTVNAVVQQSAAVRYTAATYTKAELEFYSQKLTQVFSRLVEDYGVQSVYVDVRQNRVKLETSSSEPEMTSLPSYVSGVPSEAVSFEQKDPLRTVEGGETDSEPVESAPPSSNWISRLIQLILFCVLGIWAARTIRHSSDFFD